MGKLSVNLSNSGNIYVVKLGGSLDSDTADILDEKMEEWIDEGKRYFVADLADLTYVSSAGIGVLVGVLNELEESGGNFKLAPLPEHVARVLEMLALLDLFEVYPDTVTGIHSYV